MYSKTLSRPQPRVIEFSGKSRGISIEKNSKGVIRIWWNDWACTIAPQKKIRYNHLHDLTYFAGRGGEGNPRCRCGAKVPEELLRMAMLQRIGASKDGVS